MFGDHAVLRGKGFLYREIELTGQFDGRLRYSGWWFVQRIYFSDQLLWHRITWISIAREVQFELPATDGQLVPVTLRIDCDARLLFRRFQLSAGGTILYDEIH